MLVREEWEEGIRRQRQRLGDEAKEALAEGRHLADVGLDERRHPRGRQLVGELELLPAVRPAGCRLRADAGVAEEVRRVAQGDLRLCLGGEREERRQGVDDVGDCPGGYAVVLDIEEADLREGVAELAEESGLRFGIGGQGEVQARDLGEASVRDIRSRGLTNHNHASARLSIHHHSNKRRTEYPFEVGTRRRSHPYRSKHGSAVTQSEKGWTWTAIWQVESMERQGNTHGRASERTGPEWHGRQRIGLGLCIGGLPERV
ncbi:hypothetical protein TCAP_07255 [Tolypocladium capitatum]|uniref:Uncharacterized protein n=1 Tax=Tolypocladium capitatum TaxID=45235 RepID=A0A2K3Q1A0_9HYPO|nr:hypothetical protein TCAP_07255 [Tolypocladium capitatum]